MPRRRRSAALRLLLSQALLLPTAHAQSPAAGSSAGDGGTVLSPVQIRGSRPAQAGPMPGLLLDRDEIPANVQSVGREELRRSGAVSIGEFMNQALQGVSTADYAGNPYQLDVQYRGFTASSQVGTPQGLSVFWDGIRVNEPFGDVVNWDLLPLNAIERFDLFPGSNPLFGLNTLGGALSLRTRSGFSSPGVEIDAMGGSWGRRRVNLAAGTHTDELGAFVAASVFDEDGWRQASPSRVRQLFGRGDWRGERLQINTTMLLADNSLIGNGMVPIEQAQQQWNSVYTAPDGTKNTLAQFSLGGVLDLSEKMNLTAQVHRRDSRRRAVGGDVWEDFQDLASNRRAVSWRRLPPTLPICQYAAEDLTRDVLERLTPLNGPRGTRCQLVELAPTEDEGRQLNGGFPREDGQQQSGALDAGTPTGLLNRTRLNQEAEGLGLQLNWNGDEHKAMVGVAYDTNRADYQLKQRLGLVGADRLVRNDLDHIAGNWGAAFNDVIANEFDGRQATKSLFASDTWTPIPNLHLSVAGRYNDTHVVTNTRPRARLARELDDYQGGLDSFIRCQTRDPSSCPDAPQPSPIEDETLDAIHDRARYRSFNPSVGVNWLPVPTLNLFGNWSRGSRVPSVVELGCALDLTPTALYPDQAGSPTVPRSLLGAACSLPTTLSGDPYLPQIRSNSFELGMRFRLDRRWEWNASLFQTDLRNDIYFVGAGAGRSYFDTVGKTRRRGLELGLKGSSGPFDLSLNYSFVDATFQSRFWMLSPSNSSADFDQNSRTLYGDFAALEGNYNFVLLPTENALTQNRGLGTFRNILVEPGARMPGVPAHNLNASVKWRAAPSLRFGLSMVAHSSAYSRGNDNNQHRIGGTDQQIGQYYCDRQLCPQDGFLQLPVAEGRPFRTEGKTPGFAIFNLDTAWEISKGLELELLISNLFDRRYYSASRLGVNAFAPSVIGARDASGFNYNSAEWQNTTFVAPGAPRGYFLTLRYALEM